MADQHQGQDKLPQPCLGDRQVEKDVFGPTRGCEGFAERLLGGVSLLIEELTTDFMLPGQVGDRLSTSEHLDSQISPFLGQQPLGRTVRQAGQFCDRPDVGLRRRVRESSLGVHACLLDDGAG